MSDPSFGMFCCAHGAEQAVKETVAKLGWRLAFSRPGFVTCKHDDDVQLPNGIFIRASARSIGSVSSTNGNECVEAVSAKLTELGFQNQSFDQLHVWPRDRAPIGRFGFEPGIDEVSSAVADDVFDHLKDSWLGCSAPNQIAQPGERVLDIVLVSPSQWFFGTHQTTDWPSRWPGAVQPIVPKYEPISRAYYKAAEAITWCGFDMRPGDLVVEIGSAPGGACGRLLELGYRVLGIDPAEMDPRIAKHPKFRHIRARAGDLPRKEFRGAKWLLVDSNVKPEKTLTTVANVVRNRNSDLKGLLMTLKIGDYDSVSDIDNWIEIVQSWDAKQIDIRQLARNRREVCFAVRL